MPVRWNRDEVVLVVPPPDSPSLDHEKLTILVERAARSWRHEDFGLAIRVEPTFKQRPSTKDGISTLRVLSSRWCPDGKSGDADCYNKHQVANTALQSAPWQGREERQLSEADIVINGVERSWRLPDDERDLAAVIVHELGHAIGLEHPCSSARGSSRDCAPYEGAAMHPMPMRSTFVERPWPSEPELQLLRALYPVSPTPGPGNLWMAGAALALLFVLLLGCKHLCAVMTKK